MANPLLVFEGDSLTFGAGAPTGLDYPAYVVQRLASPTTTHNVATNGAIISTINGRAATVDGFIAVGQAYRIECLWIGTNDLAFNVTTPAATYTNIVNYCNARRTAGYQIVIFTILPRAGGFPSLTFEADRQTLSANIRANWATFADYLLDVAADPNIGQVGQNTNLTYYNADQTHLNATGNEYVAAQVRTALISLVPGILMALPANSVFECRATGPSDNNGGGYTPATVSTFTGTDLVVDGSVNTKVTSVTHNFVAADVGTRLFITAGTGWTPGFYTINSAAANAATLSASPAAVGTTGGTWAEVGQDYSQQNAAQVVIDNSVITTSITTNVITFSAGYTPTNADVGNFVQMLTGTNVTTGPPYEITATTSTTWTMDRNVVTSGTTTNATGNMGGALLTLGKLASQMVASNKAYLTGAFTTAATITFAQTVIPTGALPRTRLIGYGAARGDSGRATLTLQTNTGLTGINPTGTGFDVTQIDVNCSSLGTSTGIGYGASASYGTTRNCKISNFTLKGINVPIASDGTIVECELTGGTAAATAAIVLSTGLRVIRCFIHDNACPGVSLGAGCTASFNLICNNTGASSDGIQVAHACEVLNNTIHNNGRDGIRSTVTFMINNNWRNNILSNNAGWGITATTGAALPADYLFDGNAFFSNALGTRNLMDSVTGEYGISPYVNVRDVTLSASPYVGPTLDGTANFALNNTAGAGKACRAVGVPAAWPGDSGTAGFLDMGAVQHKDAGVPGVIMATG